MKGALIAAYPNGTYDDSGPANDPFGNLAQDSGTPLGVHIGSVNELGLAAGKMAGASKAGAQTTARRTASPAGFEPTLPA